MANQSGPITIEVTAKDIANGDRDNAYRCAVALAVARKFRLNVPAPYGYSNDYAVYAMEVMAPGLNHAALPEEAIEFIRKFDKGAEVAPFSFTVS